MTQNLARLNRGIKKKNVGAKWSFTRLVFGLAKGNSMLSIENNSPSLRVNPAAPP